MTKKFKRIYIEITNICNLNCTFCPKNSRTPSFMKIEEFENILKSIKGYTDYLYFHVLGEPLLHPDIDRFLDLCKEYNYKVNITTNGTIIKEKKHKIIHKPALRQMNFSLHSFDANTLNISLDEYLDDILNFVKEADIITSLRLWNIKNVINTADKQSIYEKNRHILKRIEDFLGLDYKIEEKITSGNGIKITSNIYISQASQFIWPDAKLTSDLDSKGFCHGLRDHIAILVDGTMVPCCLDSEGTIALGNINNSSFKEVLEGERAINMYEGLSGRKLVESLCRKCDYRRRFDI